MICFQKLNDTWESFPNPYSSLFKIGSFVVQIAFHDKNLAKKIVTAFQHLAVEGEEPDVSIRLLNSPLPSLNWNLIQTNGYRGYSEFPFYFHYFPSIEALSATDVSSNIAYYAVRDIDTLPWWVSGSPLQVILHVWMKSKGLQLTHGACVTHQNKGIILSGKGNSGKSTTVYSCLQEGMHTLGEDYILLAPKTAYSVYQTAKFTPHTKRFFPSYIPFIANPDTADQEKALIHYLDIFPTQLQHATSLQAFVSLEVGTQTKLCPSNITASLSSLLSTVIQLPHSDPLTMKLLDQALQPLAHYHLILGPDLKQNVAAIKSL